MRVVTLLCVRHGESVANIRRQFAGRSYDPPLTERGHAQVTRLAHRLSANPSLRRSRVVTSPAQRTRVTGEILAAALHCDVETDDRLVEIDVGDLSGRSDDTAWKQCERIKREWALKSLDVAYPGGESLGQLLDRLRDLFEGLAITRDDRMPILVGHSGTLGAGLAHLFPPAGATPALDLTHGAVIRVRYRLDGRALRGSLAPWPVEFDGLRHDR